MIDSLPTELLENGNGALEEFETHHRGIDLAVWHASDDDATVIQVNTQEFTGRVRVYVNDGEAISDADPENDLGESDTPNLRAMRAIGKVFAQMSPGDDVDNALADVQAILANLKAVGR